MGTTHLIILIALISLIILFVYLNKHRQLLTFFSGGNNGDYKHLPYQMLNEPLTIKFAIDELLLLARGLQMRTRSPFSDSLKLNINKKFPEESEYIKNKYPRINIIKFNFEKIIEYAKTQNEFIKILSETKKFKDKLKNEFKNKGKLAIKYLSEIIKSPVNGHIICIVIHPDMMEGRYIRDTNKIIWGHADDWDNYSIVYILHEYLHYLLGITSFVHPIIELATDQELRIRLNKGGEYFKENDEVVGHLHTQEGCKKILSHWLDYLSTNEDIYDFIDRMKKMD